MIRADNVLAMAGLSLFILGPGSINGFNDSRELYRGETFGQHAARYLETLVYYWAVTEGALCILLLVLGRSYGDPTATDLPLSIPARLLSQPGLSLT